jgi:imidazolonepropionase-like amidohydrolase
MSPLEAIQSATKFAAEAVGLGVQLGTVEKGKIADLIAVDGNPLEDISVLESKDKIKLVMKDGKVFVDGVVSHINYALPPVISDRKIVD